MTQVSSSTALRDRLNHFVEALSVIENDAGALLNEIRDGVREKNINEADVGAGYMLSREGLLSAIAIGETLERIPLALADRVSN